MLAEWSAECGLEDPVLVVPWHDDAGAARFIDLRADPYDAYLIPEAEAHPALLAALRALNAGRSPVFTAKCDVWPLDPDELESLLLHLELDSAAAPIGRGSYIDLVWRDRAIFASRHRQEQVLDRIMRQARLIDSSFAMLECIMRPAVLDFGEPQEGYAVSLYLKAVGSDLAHADDEWSRALTQAVTLLRSRELAPR